MSPWIICLNTLWYGSLELALSPACTAGDAVQRHLRDLEAAVVVDRVLQPRRVDAGELIPCTTELPGFWTEKLHELFGRDFRRSDVQDVLQKAGRRRGSNFFVTEYDHVLY